MKRLNEHWKQGQDAQEVGDILDALDSQTDRAAAKPVSRGVHSNPASVSAHRSYKPVHAAGSADQNYAGSNARQAR